METPKPPQWAAVNPQLVRANGEWFYRQICGGYRRESQGFDTAEDAKTAAVSGWLVYRAWYPATEGA